MVVTYSPYSRAVPSQLHCDYMATANFDMFPRYSTLLLRLSRQLLLGCLVIVAKVIKKNKKLLHFMATFASFLLSHGRNSVVIWCERGINKAPIMTCGKDTPR